MIGRIEGKIVFYCDGKSCHDFLETEGYDFSEALTEMRSKSWSSEKDDDSQEWLHFCDICTLCKEDLKINPFDFT